MTMGVMRAMALLDQPKLIGPCCAVSLVGLVYGAVFAELGFGAAERWFEAAERDLGRSDAAPLGPTLR